MILQEDYVFVIIVRLKQNDECNCRTGASQETDTVRQCPDIE